MITKDNEHAIDSVAFPDRSATRICDNFLIY